MRPSSTQWKVAAALAALFLITVANGQLFSDGGSTSSCDPSTEVACRNHPTICISLERIQDGVADCPDASDEECSPLEFACPCGQPRCISSTQVGDGIIDCADGSDEGLVGGTCKTEDDLQDIMALDRKRRFADFRVEVNGGQTTTFDLRTETPTRRQLGLITETKGIFVNAGTTTEYATQIIGTSIDGTYAKIQNTNSRVFSVLPTVDEFSQLVDLPTGVVSSSIVTRIRGETTTIETTEFLRTFIDETYVQEIVTASEIFAPLRPESDPIQPSVLAGVLPTVVIDSSQSADDESGKIHFKTAHLTQIVGERPVVPSVAVSSVTDDERESADDDHDKKLISSFDEPISDDRLEPSTVKAAPLPTFLAGQSFDDLFTASRIAEMVDSPAAETAQQVPTDESTPLEETTESADDPTTLPPSRTGKSQLDEPSVEEISRESSREEPAIIPETEVDESLAPSAESEPVAREPEVLVDPFIVLAAPVSDEDERQRAPKADTAPFQIQTTLNIKAESTDTPAAVVVAAQEAEEEAPEVEEAADEEVVTEGPETASTDAEAEPEIQPTATETPVLMTTFTYFTTFFVPGEDGSTITSVSSREVVSTDALEEPESSTEPESSLQEVGDDQLTEMVTTLFTTYTYFTTFFDDQTTILSSHEEVVSNVLTVTEGLRVDDVTAVLSAEATETAELDAKMPSGDVLESSIESTSNDEPSPVDDVGGIVKTFFTTFTFFTTALEGESTVINSRIEVLSNVVTSKLSDSDQALWESLRLREDSSSVVDQPAEEVVADIVEEAPVAEIVEETPVADIEPSAPAEDIEPSPPAEEETPVVPVESSSSDAFPKTFYTTFTYFTTFFTEGTSQVVSREETITNVISSSEALLESSLTPILSVYPVTYYTTFTYRTTSYSLGETFVNTREETISNVVTPGVDAPTEVEPTATLDIEPTRAALQPTTFYTTFTYFTTTFDGETSVVSSSMETVTNVVSETPSIEPSIVVADSSTTARAIGESVPHQLLVALADDAPADEIGHIGLLSTIRSTQVNQGITTLFTTDILGTLINGQYAKILESSSEVLGPKPSIVAALPVPLKSPTGVLSVNVASTYNVDHPTTTVVTSRAIGTYVGELYAQLIETTTRFQVDSSLTAPADEPFRTGLIRVTTGQIVKDSLTTAYQTRVIGTFLNGLYAEILESTSSVVSASVRPAIIIAASEVVTVEPTDSIVVTSTDLEGSIQSTSESPAGGVAGSADENEEVKGIKGRITTRLSLASRSRTFTPSIRPFTQRVRPPLTLKKKRPPFAPAANEDNAGVDASPVVVESKASETTRSTLSRFRTSIAPAPISITSSKAESIDAKNRFFRPRVSSLASSINPTPVLNSLGPSSQGRRGSSSILLSSSVPRGSSSIGGRRSSIGSSFTRGSSSVLPLRSSALASTREVEAAVTEQVADVEEGTEVNVESTTSRPTFTPRQSGRFRPKTTTTPAPQTTPSTPASRRSFPLSRVSSLRTPNSFLDRTTENERDAEQSAVTTPKPRFVRPPKVTFTVKPRAGLTPQSRRLFRKPNPESTDPLNGEGSSIDEVIVVDEQSRAKRQIDYDYYLYDPAHYRRPSRGSSKTRTRSSGRFVDDESFDYIEEELVFEDEPTTPKPRNPVRDRINAQKQASSSRNTSNRRPSSTQSPLRRPTTSRPRRPSSNRQSSSSRRSKTTTTERPVSSGRRFGNGRRPSNRNKLPESEDFQEKPPQQQPAVVVQPVVIPVEVGPPLSVPLTVTHRVPTEATIPVVDGGHTEFKTVLTARPSVEILQRYTTSKIGGTWRHIASEISATPTPGVTEVTQYLIKGSETTTVTFTPTTIRGRPTSFSHIVPSTVYEIEAVVSTMSDPLAATNNLLQQLLLGNLQGNPLLGVSGATTPVTSFSTFTTTYVTTLTEQKTTKFPITLRGKEILTTLVNTATQVITATEFSTETIVIQPSIQPLEVAPVNPLASLLPALLQANPLLSAQLNLNPTPTQVLPIVTTRPKSSNSSRKRRSFRKRFRKKLKKSSPVSFQLLQSPASSRSSCPEGVRVNSVRC